MKTDNAMDEKLSRALTVCAQNLAVWQEATGENRELRLLQAEQLGAHVARAWVRGELRDASLLTRPLPTLPHTSLVPDATPFAHAMAVDEQLAFCRGYLSVDAFPLCEKEAELPTPPAAARVVFLDNYFAREALHALAPVLPHAIPVGAVSFTAAGEELASDHADFALLPIEDSVDGELTRVLEEIDRMEFILTHTCEVPYQDEGRSVTMALLAKRYRPKSGKGERRLTVSVLSEDGHTVTDLTTAALCCGMPLCRITSRPLPYTQTAMTLSVTFRADGGNVDLFRAYLAASFPHAQITHLTTHLSLS